MGNLASSSNDRSGFFYNSNFLILNNYNKYFKELDLSELVSLDVMAPILANKSIQEKLIQYLPESDILPKNEQELRTTLTTPQFKKVNLKIFNLKIQLIKY